MDIRVGLFEHECRLNNVKAQMRTRITDDDKRNVNLWNSLENSRIAEAPAEPKPSGGRSGNFKNLAATQEEEDAFDYVKWRDTPKPTGVIGSIAHMVKGALGGGILGGHVAYMKAGVMVAAPFNFLFGLYMAYCLYLLVKCTQVHIRRTRVPTLNYPDVGEAALACFPNPKVARFSKFFRHVIDTLICIDLFGACACYQIIIAKSVKQLVEDTQRTSLEGIAPGYPGLRVYLAVFIIPIIFICLITHLKWLAPFSIVANCVILFCLFVTIHYAIQFNPSFTNMVAATSTYPFFEYTGMTVFSMSCAGVVIPIENNMSNPKKYGFVLVVGMSLITVCTFLVSFFGYAAFLETCESPITVNFPMETWTKILKGAIAMMIYVTHALNFWVPFNICFYYIRKRHTDRPVMWELIYRALFVTGIGIVAIIFPNIDALMGFLGTFCLANMAFVWPIFIYLMTVWVRPGLGKYNWRLWKSLVLMVIGMFLWICGTVVNFNELISIFKTNP